MTADSSETSSEKASTSKMIEDFRSNSFSGQPQIQIMTEEFEENIR